jgi:hypothetical protein
LTGWRCYINVTEESDHDGTTERVDNEFRVNDQVQCRTFNVNEGVNYNASNKYYWRLCTGVGKDYIDLSATDCDTTSISDISEDVPEVGDSMVTVGNRTDVERQSVIIQSTVETISPSITLYSGINSYSYSNKDYISMGVSHIEDDDGNYVSKGFLDVYGDTYIGSRDRSNYVKYSPENGLIVKGKLTVTSNLVDDDGNDTNQTIQDALAEANKEANENLNRWVT